MKIKYHQDASHGWLVIREIDVRKLGLTANDFSSFSYFRVIDGVTYFALEEDADAYRLMSAAKRMGIDPEIEDVDDGYTSMIRLWSGLEHLKSHGRAA